MKRIVFALLAIVLLPSMALAAEVKLTWDPNTESDLAGYRLYQSNTANVYDKAINKVADIAAGPNANKIATVNVLPEDGRTVYFVVTAYDKSGNESGFSNEVSWRVKDLVPPAEPSLLNVLEQIANALTSLAETGMKVRIVEQ